jgi:hypothetical protein
VEGEKNAAEIAALGRRESASLKKKLKNLVRITIVLTQKCDKKYHAC